MCIYGQERNAADEKIHCLFYFFGLHRIRIVDRVLLQNIAGLVPIVPVIAKADSLTNAERVHYLNEVHALMQELGRDSLLPVTFDFQGLQETQELSYPAGESTASADLQNESLNQSYIVSGGGDDGTVVGVYDASDSVHNSAMSQDSHHSVAASPVPQLANIFAVVCSASEFRLREYPWDASVSAYDERASDFRRLQHLDFEQGKIAATSHT